MRMSKMTKNSFRPGRMGGGGEIQSGTGGSISTPAPHVDPTASNFGLGNLGGGPNLMGPPASSAPPPNLMGPPTLQGGGGPSGIATQKEPPLSSAIPPQLPPSLTGGSAQDQVNAAFGAPQFD